MKRNEIGRAGEDAALSYLQEMGMTLLARNWRSGHYELDLVMDYGNSIRIVEVKSLNEREKVIGNGSNVGGEGAASAAGAVGGDGSSGGGVGAPGGGRPSKQTGPNPTNKRETRKNKTLY